MSEPSVFLAVFAKSPTELSITLLAIGPSVFCAVFASVFAALPSKFEEGIIFVSASPGLLSASFTVFCIASICFVAAATDLAVFNAFNGDCRAADDSAFVIAFDGSSAEATDVIVFNAFAGSSATVDATVFAIVPNGFCVALLNDFTLFNKDDNLAPPF